MSTNAARVLGFAKDVMPCAVLSVRRAMAGAASLPEALGSEKLVFDGYGNGLEDGECTMASSAFRGKVVLTGPAE